MMKKIRLMMIGVLLVVSSGCFPVFVPGDGDRGRHEEHGGGGHRDGGEHEDRR
jgi:hypothetical protein